MHLVEQYQYPNVAQSRNLTVYITSVRDRQTPASVTTILPTADKTFQKPASASGKKRPTIKREALGLGTRCTHLTTSMVNPRPGGNNVVAGRAADTIIQRGLNKVGDVWGSGRVLTRNCMAGDRPRDYARAPYGWTSRPPIRAPEMIMTIYSSYAPMVPAIIPMDDHQNWCHFHGGS
jgi:hypothetical protein